MFRLVLPAALVLAVVYTAAAAWRWWILRGAPARRTWALFIGRSPRDRLLVRRVRRTDPTATVAVYPLSHDIAARLGVTSTPTLVLGDGQGGARLSASGHAAIVTLLSGEMWR